MPVPAPSLLPPFLSAALIDRKQGSVDTAYLPLPSPSTTTTPRAAPTFTPSNRLESTISKEADRDTTTAHSTPNRNHWPQTQYNDSSLLLPSSSSSLLVPPLNFDMINSGSGSGAIYRSGHPNERNFEFMSTLNLKSIIYLSTDEVRENLQSWIDDTNGSVQLYHFRLKVNKEPFAEMDQAIVAQALETVLDRRKLPCLIHCNKGKYRVGVVTALIRRLQDWSVTSAFDEYARFAGSDRIADEEFIDMFPLDLVKPNVQYAPDWLSLR